MNRKTIMAVLASFLLLAACQTEEEGTIATHYYTISTDDMSWGKADMSSLADLFSDDVRMFTEEGTTTAADALAMQRYNDLLAQVDDDSICALFPSEYDENLEEYLYYQVWLLRTEGTPDTLAGKRWSHDGTTTR